MPSVKEKLQQAGFAVGDAKDFLELNEKEAQCLENCRYKKIMIFGRPGGGKSTFALKLHQLTKIPLHHLDRYFYEANWVERDYQEFLKCQQSIVDSRCWIIDGNSTKSLEMRYSKADLVLYFNFPRYVCYWRIFKRLFDKDPAIEDRAHGCNETIRINLLRYMWNFEKRVARQLVELREKYPLVEFIEIRSKKSLWELTGQLFQDCG